MRKSLRNAAVATLAAAGIAGGSLVSTGQAQADVPNLVLTGGVNCSWGFTPGQPWTDGIWHMKRWMTVTARGADFPNVTLQEFNGEHKFVSNLKKDQSLTIATDWRACFPSSISGYTISSNADNLLDNVGFWWNLRKLEEKAPKNAAPSDKAGPNAGLSGGGNTTSRAQAQQLQAEFGH
ncbi:hypothetical protein ACLQ3C_13480 [Gordonia sp. DT30]|uniref:hypothetical protein n=1 Tax=unclassified Gordonia (in: high G+C Gram-positive bacteria) TaxID=2657482 RepID=UPI003CE6D8FC